MAYLFASNDPSVKIQIDAADLRWLGSFDWWVSKDGYARAKDGDAFLLMHREVAGVTDGSLHVDHKDRCRTNNTRANLRVSTPAENFANKKPSSRSTTGVKGVYLCAKSGLWLADITVDGVRESLGKYATVEDATRVRDAAALERQKGFAFLNGEITGEKLPDDLTKKKNSRFRGVYWCKTWSRWKANLRHEGKNIFLGTFEQEEAAGLAVGAWLEANAPERLRQKRYATVAALGSVTLTGNGDAQILGIDAAG